MKFFIDGMCTERLKTSALQVRRVSNACGAPRVSPYRTKGRKRSIAYVDAYGQVAGEAALVMGQDAGSFLNQHSYLFRIANQNGPKGE